MLAPWLVRELTCCSNLQEQLAYTEEGASINLMLMVLGCWLVIPAFEMQATCLQEAPACNHKWHGKHSGTLQGRVVLGEFPTGAWMAATGNRDFSRPGSRQHQRP